MKSLGVLALSISSELSKGGSWNEIREIVSLPIAELGLTCVASGMVTGPRAASGNPFHFNNWPLQWQDEYVRENYVQIDPLPRYALTSGAPATWTEIRSTLARNDPGHQVYIAAAINGFSEGMAIPLRNAVGDLGLVTIGGSRPKLRADEATFLQAISSAAFLVAEALDPVTERRGSFSIFTKRERDCIALLSSGLTDAEIAKALGLSRETIVSHMENARRKVSARTRAHLLSIAMQSSLPKSATATDVLRAGENTDYHASYPAAAK